MQHQTNCKFCHCLITLTIDDEYAKLGDPMNLIRLAACNRCADFIEARRRVISNIAGISVGLMRQTIMKSDKPGAIKRLEILLRSYMRIMAEHRRVITPDWDDGIVQAIVSAPSQWRDVIRRISEMTRTQEQMKL